MWLSRYRREIPFGFKSNKTQSANGAQNNDNNNNNNNDVKIKKFPYVYEAADKSSFSFRK